MLLREEVIEKLCILLTTIGNRRFPKLWVDCICGNNPLSTGNVSKEVVDFIGKQCGIELFPRACWCVRSYCGPHILLKDIIDVLIQIGFVERDNFNIPYSTSNMPTKEEFMFFLKVGGQDLFYAAGTNDFNRESKE